MTYRPLPETINIAQLNAKALSDPINTDAECRRRAAFAEASRGARRPTHGFAGDPK